MKETVEQMLEKIETMVDEAPGLPLSRGRCLIVGDDLRDIVDAIRGALPDEIRQAKAIVDDRADIIDAAKEEAEAIIQKAEERSRALVSQEEVVKQAQQKSTELLNQSQQKSREMRRSATDFAEDLLKRTEESLSAQLQEVRQTRQSLRKPAQVEVPQSEEE